MQTHQLLWIVAALSLAVVVVSAVAMIGAAPRAVPASGRHDVVSHLSPRTWEDVSEVNVLQLGLFEGAGWETDFFVDLAAAAFPECVVKVTANHIPRAMHRVAVVSVFPSVYPLPILSPDVVKMTWTQEPRHALRHMSSAALNFDNLTSCTLDTCTWIPHAIFAKTVGPGLREHTNNSPRHFRLGYFNSFCSEVRDAVFLGLAAALGAQAVTAGGACQTTHKVKGSWRSGALITAMSRCTFVLAMENSQHPGYVTEKMVNALRAGAVPIYWGPTTGCAQRLFNPEAFVDISHFGADAAGAVEHVLAVMGSPRQVAKMQAADPLTALGKQWTSWRRDGVQRALPHLVRRFRAAVEAPLQLAAVPRSQPLAAPASVRFVALGIDAQKAMASPARTIQQEAQALGIFDAVQVYGELPAMSPQDDARLEQHKQHKRGAGYWWWKPVIIERELDKAGEGDLVVYVDAGCILSPGEMWDRILRQQDVDVVAFRFRTHLELQWTRRSVLEAMHVEPQDASSGQIASTAMVFRNTAAVRRLVAAWKEAIFHWDWVRDQDPSLSLAFTQRFNHKEFIEHRHDQSLFSVLCKRMARRGELRTHCLSHRILETPGSIIQKNRRK